jgi:hypothetical protein
MQKNSYVMAVACKNSAGEPDLFVCTVMATEAELQNGDCYDEAIEQAGENRYESAEVAYDHHDIRQLKDGIASYDAARAEVIFTEQADRADYLSNLINSSDAFIIDGSPLLGDVERRDNDFYFCWHNPEFDSTESVAIPLDRLGEAEMLSAGVWRVWDDERTQVDLCIYNLAPAM